MEGAQTRVYVWGFLAFQSVLWTFIAVILAAVRYSQSEGGDFGAILETGGALAFIFCGAICIGIPLSFFSGFMAWRNNAELQTERRHREMMEMQRQGLPPRQ